MIDVEMNSTAITIAIQRELADLARIRKADRQDGRLQSIYAGVNELAVARMNLKGQ